MEFKVSLELLIIELGLSLQPLQQSYEHYGGWVPHCLLRTLWEKCHKFKLKVVFANSKVTPPRGSDHWLMELFIHAGYCPRELMRLNRV